MDTHELILKLIEQLQGNYQVLNDHSGTMTADIAVLKTQMAEINWWSKLVMGGILIMIVERTVSIISVYKKNGNGKK